MHFPPVYRLKLAVHRMDALEHFLEIALGSGGAWLQSLAAANDETSQADD
jgi:hypothetical protein